MSDEPTDTDTEGIEAELKTVLRTENGGDPLKNLRAIQTGPVHYTVLSARNGNASGHRVNVGKLECTCGDMQYNRNEETEGTELCAHLAFAMLEHPQLEHEEAAVYQHLGVLDETERVLQRLRDEHDVLQNIAEDAGEARRIAETAAGAQTDAAVASDGAESPADEPSGSEPDAGAQDAADRLQEAFDDVIDDMQVKANQGIVWFQTGSQTPDDWPFSGGDDTFSVVMSPDMVMYVHDGSADWADGPHKHYDLKPGEWWKNALEPEDVDDYIAEVLE